MRVKTDHPDDHDDFIGLRIANEYKADLEDIAAERGEDLSQLCRSVLLSFLRGHKVIKASMRPAAGGELTDMPPWVKEEFARAHKLENPMRTCPYCGTVFIGAVCPTPGCRFKWPSKGVRS